jgi:hypothetical protein
MGLGANNYSLQLNTNYFSTKACPSKPPPNPNDPHCQGWVQFAFNTTQFPPPLFLQYWLINFCPPSSPNCPCPTSSTVTWASKDNGANGVHEWDCYTPINIQGSMEVFPAPLFTDLHEMVLTGTTGATNTAYLFFPPANLVAKATLDDALGLNNADWNETEFNLFGANDGTEAVFNADAILNVQTLTSPIPYPDQDATTPIQCDSTSFTGETNDRQAYSCWTVPGGIEFTEGPQLPSLAGRALALAFNPLGWIDWIDGRPGQPGPTPDLLPYFAVTETTQVVRLTGASASNATSSFTPSALSLLAGVAAGTADALVGDDVAEGVVSGTAPISVVVVDRGTTTVQGALGVSNGLVQGIHVTPLGTNVDPPDLRAFDAYDAALYSLHVPSTGATLTRVDTDAALHGLHHVTTAPLVGDAPEAPLALVWNRFTKTLFVVDLQAEKKQGQKRQVLRLLTIDPVTARGHELWRTRAMHHGAPSSAYLSVSFHAEVVLALAHEGSAHDTEVLLLDATGTPQLSVDTERELTAAPQALPAGVDLPVFVPVRPGVGDDVGTRVALIRREDMHPGICGAPWLAAHATGALAHAARACGRPDDQ